jgi:uncharacterized phage-associated protein
MFIPFHPLKAAQAAAVLLKMETTRRMSRLRLLKLLYVADREALAERLRPIIGDRPVAMDHGPVLSHTYDLIKGQDAQSPLLEQFLRSVGRDVEMTSDPGVGELSRYEISKLQTVAQRFQDLDDWTVAEATHAFPEWVKNRPAKGSSNFIPIDDLLAATDTLDRKREILEVESAEGAFDRLVASERK